MKNGFLDNLPDLGMGKPAKKKPEKDEVVVWHKIKCPKCKSEKVPVYSTQGRIRYHKCAECNHNFKSIEEKG